MVSSMAVVGEFERFIRAAANMLTWGEAPEDVRLFLLNEGLTEEEAYLAYSAGRVLARSGANSSED